MIWTGWNNGNHKETGAGYGLKVAAVDRDRCFKRDWRTVFVELPTQGCFVTAEVNVAKESFWGPECRELISKDIGRWMLDRKYAPWRSRFPPKFEVEPAGDRQFRARKRIAG